MPMPFILNKDGFECTGIDEKQCKIQSVSIVEICAYTADLFTYDELRISIETSHGVIHHFSEQESGLEDLTAWVGSWGKLAKDWPNTVYTKPFSGETISLWKLNT